MATIYIQKRKGQKTQRTVNSVEELDVVLRGLANKDRISADGSRWYQKRKLRGPARDALIREAGLSESQISDSGGTASAGAEVSTEGGDGTAGKATPPTVPAPDRAKEAAPRRTSTKKAPPPQDPEVLKQLQNIQQGLVSLADAVDGKADRDQVGPAVEEAVREMGAPLEQRVTNLLSDVQVQLDRVQKGLLREEEVLEEVEGQWGQMEQLVRRCRPGRVQELEQQVDALRDEADRHRAELTERNTIIDRLERELDRLKLAGGEQSLEDEERKLQELRQALVDLKTRGALQADNDRLREQLAELDQLRSNYERYQNDYEQDLALRQERDALQRQVRTQEAELRRTREAWHDAEPRLRSLERQVQTLREERRTALQERDEAVARSKALGDEVEDHRNRQEAVHAAGEQLTRELAALDRTRRRTEEELRAQYAQVEDDLRTYHQNKLGVDEEDMRRRVRQEHEHQVANLESRVAALDRERVQLQARVEAAEDEVAKARQGQVTWNRDHADRVRERTALEERITGQHKELEEIEAVITAIRRRLDGYQQEREQRFQQLDQDLKDREQQAEAALADIRRQIEEAGGTLAARKEELTGLEERFAEKNQHYEDLIQRKKRELDALEVTADERTASIDRPLFDQPLHCPADGSQDELAWLDHVVSRFEEAGFHFPRRLLESFHTCLKIAAWSPLTALAGVSGTGKSELPRLYAACGGLHFLPMAVQPNWDSPQDLFGFFNYMDNRYKATPLMRTLAQCQLPEENPLSLNHGLVVVLLDEMNLARVEQYFSEVLSKLGSTRMRGDNGHQAHEALEVDVGLGATRAIRLGGNVLWVGTMNEDETTHDLSDKVLDRGNVLAFPRPRKLRGRPRTVVEPVREGLAFTTWNRWVREPEQHLHQEARQAMAQALDQMNGALSLVGRAVGHRVRQAVEAYVANHPKTTKSVDAAEMDDSWIPAFEDQVAQRLMPKARGVDMESEGGKLCRDRLRDVLEEHAPGLLEDFEEASTSASGTFVWRGSSYLKE